MANPLFQRGVPREEGYPSETFAFPSDVTLDDPVYPEFTGIAGGPSAYRSNTGEVFQSGNPEYAGEYFPGFQNDPGTVANPAPLNPAPGSVDLAVPRETGGVAGTNRLIKSEGPVDGAGADLGITWTGDQGDLYRPNPNYHGPVVGGPDYAQQLGNAFYADQLAGFSEIAATAALVSAV